MKVALIDPREEPGRVCQVEDEGAAFEVAAPLFWTACPDECQPDAWTWTEAAGLLAP